MGARDGADGGTKGARRCKERRLRSWLRHEQHSRNQKTAAKTGKGEEYVTHYMAKFRKTPLPKAAATVFYPLTDDEGGELAAGARPTPLLKERPQEMVERHAGIGYELVLPLDAPVLQMVEEVDTDVLALLAFQEQAIVTEIPEVPRRWCALYSPWTLIRFSMS